MLVKVLLLSLSAVIVHRVWKVCVFLAPRLYVYSHQPGPCRIVPGIDNGAEDMQALKNGKIIISSGLYSYGTLTFTGASSGKLLLYDMSEPGVVQELKLPSVFDNERLNPHGISVWEEENSEMATLFVINHSDSGERVEKFHLNTETLKLTHVRSIRDPGFNFLNDITAAGEDSFFVTQQYYFQSEFLRNLEVYMTLPTGSILYYDGSFSRSVSTGYVLPNGIYLSRDANYLYVAEFGTSSILVFYHDSKTHNISLLQKFNAHTGVDNLDIDADGDIWAGCHPSLIQSISHMSNGKAPAPSQVLKLKTQNGLIVSMTEVFADEGNVLYGSTIGIYRDHKLLIGSVRHKVLLCDVLYNES